MAPVVRGGYWGDITSSVDWCEENYEWTPYIAEFFNAWSSLAMVFLGESCAHMNPTGHKGFTVLSRTITVVGIGSWLFHATLKYQMQMLDELPMLWSVATALYMTLVTQTNISTQRLQQVLGLWTLVVTAVTAGCSGQVQFLLFQFSFNICTVVVGYMLWRAKRGLDAARMGHIGRLFVDGSKVYLCAAAVWLIDTNLCPYINGHDLRSVLPVNLQLHAWWHVLVSFGLTYLVVLMMAHYCVVNSIPFKFKRVLYIFPYICAAQEK
ncbi:alkaline phytoceramidase [Linderina pennispora]|uniref:Alkaline phytoceramidase n=1 Tax=Linderina pennispora TaxID=61395 RepID=A0A1Y1WHQ4_9FUNG|nr:alkaline phytoceramidase [Linderina pennispora]ORX72982.1 alkaline phytoceramidase [Linderina pennispora]